MEEQINFVYGKDGADACVGTWGVVCVCVKCDNATPREQYVFFVFPNRERIAKLPPSTAYVSREKLQSRSQTSYSVHGDSRKPEGNRMTTGTRSSVGG